MARLMAPGASNAEFAQVFMVSDNYFSVLGVSALHGRTFGPGNTAESVSPPSVLVSENYWRRRFAADPAMVGKINLNAYAERFVRSIKESCLDRLIFFGEGSLRKGIDEFVRHYHGERNHQGLGNRLIVASECQAGQGEQCSAVSVWAAC